MSSYRLGVVSCLGVVVLIIVLTGHQTENDNAAAFSRATRRYNNVWGLVLRDLQLSRCNRLFILNNQLERAGFLLLEQRTRRRNDTTAGENPNATCNSVME